MAFVSTPYMRLEGKTVDSRLPYCRLFSVSLITAWRVQSLKLLVTSWKSGNGFATKTNILSLPACTDGLLELHTFIFNDEGGNVVGA